MQPFGEHESSHIGGRGRLAGGEEEKERKKEKGAQHGGIIAHERYVLGSGERVVAVGGRSQPQARRTGFEVGERKGGERGAVTAPSCPGNVVGELRGVIWGWSRRGGILRRYRNDLSVVHACRIPFSLSL